MKVAVTGSSGMIGSALMQALTARGDQVVRVLRPRSHARPGLSAVYWDPRTGQIDRDGLEGLDAVVHLAGASIAGLWTSARKRRILESRERGTSLLANTLAALERRPAVLISVSGIGYYGNRRPDETIDESAGKGAGFMAEVADRWEAAAAPAEAVGIRVVHPRLGLVLSKDGGALKPLLPAFYVGLGGRLGSGRQIWSWVALDDVVGGLLHLFDTPLKGPVNVTAPNPVSNAEFTRTLAGVLHRPALLPLPEIVLKLGGDMVEELLLWGARVLPRKLLESGYTFRFSELRPALQAVLAGEVGS